MVTPIYAAILALFFVFLSVRTLRLRRQLKIAIGTGDSELMLRAMRVHSNFAEYVTLALLLALMLELLGGHLLAVHFVCMALVLGRISHAYGVSRTNEDYRYRVFGMALTFTSICTSSLILLFISAAGEV